MEKTCEFCGAPRPIIYCQADAAFLCLSCDAKVHSANALSGRHLRDLLCNSCGEKVAFVQCLDHSMLLCRGCESDLHDVFSIHRKLMLKSFTGCPSAKHFAALWGFNVSEQAQFSANSEQIGSESCVSTDRGSVKLNGLGTAESNIGSSRQKHKIPNNHHLQEKNNRLIMQQILDLKNLQLSEADNEFSPTFTSSGKLDEGLEGPLQEMESTTNERLPAPISQLDLLSCSSSVGDGCWQHKSPLDTSQFWSQNLLDLGVCEDPGSFDDFNMPDVDLSFRNFEDLFTNDVDVTRPLFEDHDHMWPNIEKEASIDGSENSRMITTENVSAASAISTNNDITSKNEAYQSKSMEYSPLQIRASYSVSFSRSLLSAESSGSDCLDSGHSGKFTEAEAEAGESSTRISRKRTKTRLHGKQSQLAPCKDKVDARKKIKGRFINLRNHEFDKVNVTKSY